MASAEKGKGKGKDKDSVIDEATAATPTAPDDPPSSVVRISASAAGLTRAWLNPSHGDFLAGALATTLNGSQKGSGSGSATGPYVSSTSSGVAVRESATNTLGRPPISGSVVDQETFRSADSDSAAQHERVEHEYDAFLHTTPPYHPPERLADDDLEGGDRLQAAAPASSHISPTDGADVVALLWSTEFSSMTDIPVDEGEEGPSLSNEDLFNSDVAPSLARETTSTVLAGLPEPFSNDVLATMDDWDGFLHRYVDEVWGDLLPLVKDARREVEEARAEEGGGLERHRGEPEGSALRRLGMLLRHLRDDGRR